jgi:hypothetical protein
MGAADVVFFNALRYSLNLAARKGTVAAAANDQSLKGFWFARSVPVLSAGDKNLKKLILWGC